VLEEAGLKIDYIGGTSMGSVVGCMHQDIPQLKLILFSIDKF
jgi:predicted acylesterase/phospholipase RssA